MKITAHKFNDSTVNNKTTACEIKIYKKIYFHSNTNLSLNNAL